MSEKISCACPSTDRYSCIRARYPQQFICDDATDAPDPEPCECSCHDIYDYDDEDGW